MRKRALLRHFDVYSDGSVHHVRQKQTRMGAGWVVRENNGLFSSGAQVLPAGTSGSCLVAEFKAAALALKSVPRGSHVTLHTDSHSLRQFMLTGILPKGGPGSTKRESPLRDAAAELIQNALRHVVVVQPSRDKNSPYLEQAHRLACRASGNLAPNTVAMSSDNGLAFASKRLILAK